MNIVPLSHENIEEAIKLAHKVFPLDSASSNPPERGFRKSLSQESVLKSWRGPEHVLSRLNYWVLLDDNSHKVIGVTGLYGFKDNLDEVWLAWYCIDPEARGKGMGRRLLEWTIDKARSEGYKLFKLYTSTDPNESVAQKLYESLGLEIINREKDVDSPYEIIYRQINL